jgi:hypothetical protein
MALTFVGAIRRLPEKQLHLTPPTGAAERVGREKAQETQKRNSEAVIPTWSDRLKIDLAFG